MRRDPNQKFIEDYMSTVKLKRIYPLIHYHRCRKCGMEYTRELHDKFEKISDVAKVLIVGKKMDAIGKMISAMAETRIQNELEQKCKDLGIQVQEDPIAKLLVIIDEMHFGDNFPIECLEPPKQEISTLKKRIKYCKNPMEKKKLEQELNALYKEHKRNRG